MTISVFSATDGIIGTELWVTDGTEAGTMLVKDINNNAGETSSSPQNFISLGNGKVLFTANNGTTGVEPWVTDGTAVGTMLLKDINGTTDSYAQQFVLLGNRKALFTADDGTNGEELWITDGTEAGTMLVKDIYTGGGGSSAYGFLSLGNGKVLFSAEDVSNGQELWVSDGTAAGTMLVKDIAVGSHSTPDNFISLGNGMALFTATDATNGEELWVSDGTEAGTMLFKDINAGTVGSSAGNFFSLGNGKVLFSANGGTTGQELWVSDGTAAGTVLVKDINAGSVSSSPGDFVSLGNGSALFTASDAANGKELWITDGTEAGTMLVKDIRTGIGSSSPINLVSLGNGTVLFRAYDLTNGTELWVSDGTEAGTMLVKDIYAGSTSSTPSKLVSLGNGTVLFQAENSANSTELWLSDGTAAGTLLVKDINAITKSSSPTNGVSLGNGKALFQATDGINGQELWVSDGTAAGTMLVKDINAGGSTSNPQNFVSLGNDKVLFNATDATNGQELWVSDGTEAGTMLVKDINAGTTNSSPGGFVFLGNGQALFQANNATNGIELWVSDGTAAGTVLVKDIRSGNTSSNPTNLVSLGNGNVLFQASDATNGAELWVSDGTAAGTTLVKNIRSGSSNSSPANLVSLGNGTVLFSANDGINGIELWVSDGTTAGTMLVKDINSGTNNSSPANLVFLGNGKVLFSATDATNGQELWVSDGTTAGTMLVKDVNAGVVNSALSNFVSLGNGKVLFNATDGINGAELWVSDGTTAGTMLVKDINAGANSSLPQRFVSLGNGKVLFNATDGVNGAELWVSDGTTAGTMLVKDINAGSIGSSPANFVSLGNGTVLFSATDVVNSTELWISDGTAAGTMLAKDINIATNASSPQNFTPITFSNVAPVLTGSAATLTNGTQNQAYIINSSDLLTGYTDADSDPLSIANLASSSGSVVNNNDGTYTLTTTVGFTGNIDLSYNVIDGIGGSVAASNSVDFVASTNRIVINSSVTYTLATGQDDLVLTGTANINGTGNSLDNIITGNSGNNILDGGADADTLTGGAGDDTYIIDNIGDVVIETTPTLSSLGSIVRANTSSSGVEANAFSDSPALSADGTQVVFESYASNLVADDTNNTVDIFVKNLSTGALIRVSTDSNGVEANNYSNRPVFSADGTQVLFESFASNLVANDTNNQTDIFVKNLSTGALIRVSTDSSGVEVNDSSSKAVFSVDGTQVLFESYASNLVANDNNNAVDIFVKNLTTGAVTRVSTDSSGAQANDGSYNAAFSADGTQVVFESYATNLVAGDINGNADIFVKNLITGAVIRVETDNNNEERTGPSVTPAFSPDGTQVVFASYAINWVVGDTNNRYDIFVKNLSTGTLTRVSTNSNGEEGSDNSYNPIFSADGTHVIFESDSYNLVADDGNGQRDIFLKNLATGAVTRVSTDSSGAEGYGMGAYNPALSADGTKLVFRSHVGSFVAGDNNNEGDIFVKNLYVPADAGGTDTVQSSITYTLGQYVENLTLTGSEDLNGTGNSLDNVIIGTSGNNILDGGAGMDALSGGSGNDTYIVDSTTDTIADSAGIDTVQSSKSYSLSTHTDLENLSLTGSANINATGNSLDNVITGNSGNNILDGGEGSDTLTGGSGNDTYIIDSATDTIVDSAGIDTVQSSLSYNLSGQTDLENITLTGSADLNGTGSAVDNVIAGNSGNNLLDGLEGADTLTGGAGNDTYIVDNVGDVVMEAVVVVSSVGSIVRANTSSSGLEADGGSYNAVFSADGTQMLFESYATNLVADDTNNQNDIFVKNLSTGTLTRANTSSSGVEANNFSNNAVLSADGTQVLFGSYATNLVADDTNNQNDIFVKNLSTGTLTRANTSSSGVEANNFSNNAVLSADGTQVLFESYATNLVADDTNNDNDIFVKNLSTGALTRVNTDSSGAQGEYGGYGAVLSADGTQVLFESYSSNLVANDTNNSTDIFVKNLSTGALIRVSTDSNGLEGNGSSSNAVLSADGTHVMFESNASNLVAGDTNDTTDLFVKNLSTGVVTRVSSNHVDEDIEDSYDNPVLSSDGTQVIFESEFNNLVADDTNDSSDIFVKNISTGELIRVSTDSNGVEGNNYSYSAVFSADGTHVMFESDASNLVADDTNNQTDIFVKNLSTGAVIRVSTDSSGLEANSYSSNAIFSADGTRVLFASGATNLVVGDANNQTDFFVKSISALTDTGGIDTVQSSVSYTLGQYLENLTLTGSADLNGTGNTLDNVLTGNSGNNMLEGGSGNDILDGDLGTDTAIYSNSWANYTVTGNSTSAIVTGVEGTDTLLNIESISFNGITLSLADAVNDNPIGVNDNNSSDAVIEASPSTTGDNTATGNVLSNDTDLDSSLGLGETKTVSAVAGQLTNVGTSTAGTYGSVVINANGTYVYTLDNNDADTQALTTGQSVNDNFTYTVIDAHGATGSATLSINIAGSTDAVLVESAVSYTLSGVQQNLTLTGTANINGTGNSLNNIITGNSGNNILDGKAGADTLIGGLGNDTYYVDNIGDVVTENVGEGTDIVYATLNYTLVANVENVLLLGTANLNSTGNELKNSLVGNSGNNNLSGGLGNDALNGGLGVDTLTGGLGDDTYYLDNVGDVVTENLGEGTDTLYSTLDYTLLANVEHLILQGTANLNGTGNELDNRITGNSGNNILNGGVGKDTLIGGLGDDTYYVDITTEVITEQVGAGTDLVYSTESYTLAANVENLVLQGTANINGTGNTLNNMLVGNAGNNILNGSTGVDTVAYGLWSNYSVVGTASNATVSGGDGTDTLISIENLKFNGVLVSVADAINDAPIGANDDNSSDAVIEMGMDIVGDASAVGNVLVNDSDADDILGLGETKTVSAVAGQLNNVGLAVAGTYGSVVINADGTYTYTLDNNDVDTDTLIIGQTVNDNFSYTVIDAHGVTGTATLAILISGSADRVKVQSAISYTLQSGEHDLLLTGAANVNGTGNSLDNIIIGNSGNNALDGKVGADTLTGGLGNDTYSIDNVGDVVTENVGEGTDTVNATINYSLLANFENLLLQGTAGLIGTGNELNNSITGNSGNNVLSGGLGNDVLNGGLGIDTLTGGLGNDTYSIDNVGDVVTENVGEGTDTVNATINYSLLANFENLLLQGTAGLTGTGNELNNSITGNNANNALIGGLGNDTLDGKVGADTLTGGLGNDIYYVDQTGDVVTEASGEGTDIVYATISYSLVEHVENLLLREFSHLNGTGNSLDNYLTGNTGNNILSGGLGKDTLVGGLGNDTYSVGRGDGQDIILETSGTADVLSFLSGVSREQLWFKHSGNNLEVSIIGTTDKVTVNNWYVGGTVNQVEEVHTASGNVLISSQVESLVTAMASFTPPSVGTTTLDSGTYASVLSAITTSWSS